MLTARHGRKKGMWMRQWRTKRESDMRDYDLFTALLPEHIEALVRMAAALVGTADAEDAVQEAITRAWQAWPTLREPVALRAWLLRITANVCRDWLRGRFGTRNRLTEPLPADDALARLDGDPGASDHTAALDLRRAINLLEGDLRVIIALRYYAGMDASEIGAALSMPSATVRTRLRRALFRLREQLYPADDIPLLSRREGGC